MSAEIQESMPLEVYNRQYEAFYGNGGHADEIFPSQEWLERERKSDIEDTFVKLRGPVGEMLAELGIEDPSVQDRIVMYSSFQQHDGFESGVKFMHDNFRVSLKGQSTWIYNEDTDPALNG